MISEPSSPADTVLIIKSYLPSEVLSCYLSAQSKKVCETSSDEPRSGTFSAILFSSYQHSENCMAQSILSCVLQTIVNLNHDRGHFQHSCFRVSENCMAQSILSCVLQMIVNLGVLYDTLSNFC